MSELLGRVLDRHRHNIVLLSRFVVVGGLGVLVNMAVLIMLRRIGPHFDDAVFPLGGSGFHLRWYHVFSTVAFLVANLSNFLLNRHWTFRSAAHSAWWREYWPFLAVGLVGQGIGLALLTLLMHPHSFLSLPADVLDNSSGWRTRLYWAQLIVIVVTTPLTFLLNKVWTFASVRDVHRQGSRSSAPEEPSLPR
ncbi:MAG: GtrA family protein [Nocardioides sp.]|uniref:GtrA family protein n=1 Tax=Nocardioides sp. TaxID=35761 RepID=UPI003F0F1145